MVSSETWASGCVRRPWASLVNLTADIFSCEWAPLAPGENCVTSHQRNSHIAKQMPTPRNVLVKRERERCSCICLHNTCTGKQLISVRSRADTKLIHLMEMFCFSFCITLTVFHSRWTNYCFPSFVPCLPSPSLLVITENVCISMKSIYSIQTHKPTVFGWKFPFTGVFFIYSFQHFCSLSHYSHTGAGLPANYSSLE